MSARARAIAAAALAGAVALGVALITGGDERSETANLTGATVPTSTAPNDARPPAGAGDRPGDGRPDPDPDPKPDEVAEGPSGPPPASAPEREAAATVRRFIDALNGGDGEALCALFEPGALDAVDFPRERGSCAATLAASIGYRDPKGLPVWRRSEVTDAISAQVSGDEARVVATVFTIYEDVREPSIEDDIVYLRASGDEWSIAKPSATLYRAVGIADVPPSVLAPPG